MTVLLCGVFAFGSTGAGVTPESSEQRNNTIVIKSDDEKKAAERSERAERRQASVLLHTEEVEYSTTIVEDKGLPEGVEVVAREGVVGEKSTYRSYVPQIQADGTQRMVPIKHSEITVVPVNEIVRKGVNGTKISAVSDKALAKEAERRAEEEAERAAEQAEREAEREAAERAEREAAAERAAQESASSSQNSSSSRSSSSSNSSSGGSASVDTSASAAEMKAQVAPGQVTTPEQNRAYAKAILSPADFEAADKLVKRESRWITTAANPNSSAYGVPQSLPGNKMASAGSDWRANGMTQFDWMISYVEGRYGSFQNALQHSYTHGWY